MRITIVGTGYVGLVGGVCFAEAGNDVIMVDIDSEKVKALKNKQLPIYELGLPKIFERNFKAGRLHFTTDLKEGIKNSEVIFFALPTPEGKDGNADLSAIRSVAAQAANYLDAYRIFVNKSTVPVGTAKEVTDIIQSKTDVPFDVVSNPEFLREGVAVDDFMKPDRIVIGTNSETARKIMKKLYEPFVQQGNPIYFMDNVSAEMVKYAANAYLATRITFMNEIANICERVHANVDSVRLGMGSDARIGKRFLFAGAGYGGSCFPKDTQALYTTAQNCDYHFKVLGSVLEKNTEQKQQFFKKIATYFQSKLKDKKIAVWGIAFKANTDDIREAPALTIIDLLLKNGALVSVFDPEAMPNFEKNPLAQQTKLGKDSYGILKDADALVILTEWGEFKNPDFSKIKSLMKSNIIFDGRNLYSLEEMNKEGFTYFSVGREVQNA